MKVRAVIKLMEKEGWYLTRTKGSHRQYKHLYKRGLVTISGHLNDVIAKGTLNSILKQAGLKVKAKAKEKEKEKEKGKEKEKEKEKEGEREREKEEDA